MQKCLFARANVCDSMCIRVPGQQQCLEEAHARCPRGRCTAKPWQEKFAEDELNFEEQKRAQKNDDTVCQRTAIWISPERVCHLKRGYLFAIIAKASCLN